MTAFQLSLLDEGLEDIINVSKVPQLSPFRYPGGKTWLVPRIRRWLFSIKKPAVFIEPFAGGGIASLTAAFEALADKVLMVELDEAVAAAWQTILHPTNCAWLAKRILEYELTRNGCEADLLQKPRSIREKAFLTILRNRVCRGGILAKGAGFIEYGENGKGVHSRWYPETLKRRITEINRHRQRIEFRQGDAFSVIKEFRNRTDVALFIDPPYTASKKKAGSRLYTHFNVDHDLLFSLASQCRGQVLMTYDCAEEIQQLAARYKLKTQQVAMKNNHHAEMKELLIGNDLSWI